PAEQVGEDIADVVGGTAPGVVLHAFVGIGEIAVEATLRALGAAGVDLATVEAGTLFRVAEQLVGGGNLLELRLRLLVAGVQVRMPALRQAPVGLPDLLLARIAANAEDLIWIAHGNRSCL